MIDEHDKKETRCRRLGHDVPFLYCRRESGETPCRLVLDCWWQRFDAQAYIDKHFPGATAHSPNTPPPSKVRTILDIIQQAKSQAPQDSGSESDKR